MQHSSSTSSPGTAFPRRRGELGGVPGFLGVERSGLRNCPYSTTPLAPANTSLSLPPGRARGVRCVHPGQSPKRACWKGAIHHLPFQRILARAQPGPAPTASPKDTCAAKLCQNPASGTPQKPRTPAACPTLAPQRSLPAWHLPSRAPVPAPPVSPAPAVLSPKKRKLLSGLNSGPAISENTTGALWIFPKTLPVPHGLQKTSKQNTDPATLGCLCVCACVSARARETEHRPRVRATAARAHLEEGEGVPRRGDKKPPLASGPRAGPACSSLPVLC
ncbi:max-binding protein MNT-like [Cebus imitator]|uniref:max-binding protein MNT-like n=1 Tax=Cebus imitator TaxID=2715852 RepID=UPI00189A90C9|nr:max-binding protein MNT-like [Cebus imitator]